MNTNPYSIHVSNTSYTPGGMMTVVINGTMGIKVNEYGSTDLWILLLTSSYLWKTDESILLVKSICEPAQKSLLWIPPLYQDLSTLHN